MDAYGEKPESLDRFWDPKLETLGELLDQLSEDGAMDLEELDGFFTALHCCPQLVPPAEYLSEVLGNGAFAETDEFFSTPEAAKLLFGLLIEHWNAVGDAFRTQDFFIPLLLEDDDGKALGNNWAIGFMRGVDMREESWNEILGDDSKCAWFYPILTLADENLVDDEPAPEALPAPDKVPVTDEEREQLLLEISADVTEMYRYFAPHRKLNASVAAEQNDPFHAKRKIGRNDPCYCGSGEKYKKCCGAIKVN